MPPEPAPVLSDLGLPICTGVSPFEQLVDFLQPQVCETGSCWMQADGATALDDGLALVFGEQEHGPDGLKIAVLDDSLELAPFAAIPDLADKVGSSVGDGAYVAACGASDKGPSFLYEWREEALARLATLDGIAVQVATAAPDVVVAGYLEKDNPWRRTAWLAAYDDSGTERWRVGSPSDPGADQNELSGALARDASDGSLSWLIVHYEDADWFERLVRIDRNGNQIWARRLAPLGNTGVATAGGVTSIAGWMNGLRLTFRQYDDAGAEIRRWDGLDTAVPPNLPPVVADDHGNVYVAWYVDPIGSPEGTRTVILRFAPRGEPCLVADVRDQFPVDLALRGDELLLATFLSLGRVLL